MDAKSAKSLVGPLLLVTAILLLSVIGRFFWTRSMDARATRASSAAVAAEPKEGERSDQAAEQVRRSGGGGEAGDDGAEASEASAGEVARALAAAERPTATEARPTPLTVGETGTETELERQNRLWREGVAAGRTTAGASRLQAEAEARKLFPADPVAEIVWTLGFEWGSR